jgi:hypothetical protein
MRQHKMVAVAIVTGGSNNQPSFEKPPAMNTLGVILNNIVFRYVINPCNNFTFSMTFSAKERYIHFIGTGIGIGIMQNIMVAVALLATGGIWIIHQQRLSVHTPCVRGHGFCMAGATIYWLQVLRMWEAFIISIAMARNTGVAVVHRSCKN